MGSSTASSESAASDTPMHREHDLQQSQQPSMSLEDRELALALKSYVPGTEEEKRLVRKIDFILLPVLWWMYILAYLDKGNIVGFLFSCSTTTIIFFF